MTSDLPRNQDLPIFDPHRPDFTCMIETEKVPAIDAEANDWFLEARSLEDPEIFIDDRNHKKIVQLTRQAADRHHWKAMLNLASMYLEGRDPARGREDAVLLVEAAMRLGIPAAYDRMGTYHKNGIVPGGMTKAFTFFQRAAEMGSPEAMTFLGYKMNAVWDSPADGFWANVPIAKKMFECALGQGYGPAAYKLQFLYMDSRSEDGNITGPASREGRARALKILHEGARLGCELCAHKLEIEFGRPHDLAQMVAPYIDKARSERYGVLGDALGFNPSRRFPNLDKVLPLPPALLPPWDGKRASLLKAAMAVTPRPVAPKPTAASQRKGRYFLDAKYDLRQAEEKTNAAHAPVGGYWQPTAPHESEQVRAHLASISPGAYQLGEAFDKIAFPENSSRGPIPGVIWQRLLTVRRNDKAVAPQAAAGLSQEVVRPEPHVACRAGTACPVTGIWQPWLSIEHPLHSAVNQPWRQAWVTAGRPFPEPENDWLLPLEAEALTWHLMDSTPPNQV